MGAGNPPRFPGMSRPPGMHPHQTTFPSPEDFFRSSAPPPRSSRPNFAPPLSQTRTAAPAQAARPSAPPVSPKRAAEQILGVHKKGGDLTSLLGFPEEALRKDAEHVLGDRGTVKDMQLVLKKMEAYERSLRAQAEAAKARHKVNSPKAGHDPAVTAEILSMVDQSLKQCQDKIATLRKDIEAKLSTQPKERTFAEVSGLDEAASLAEVERGYRRFALKYHPDKTRGDKEKEEKFKLDNPIWQAEIDKRRAAKG